jgi:hypothetical protein
LFSLRLCYFSSLFPGLHEDPSLCAAQCQSHPEAVFFR